MAWPPKLSSFKHDRQVERFGTAIAKGP